jgi:IS5 family transposase
MANAEGKPLVFILTPGNVADISVAACLLDGIAPSRRVLADKACDADHLRKPLEAQDTRWSSPPPAPAAGPVR